MRVEWKNASGEGSGLFAANRTSMFSLVRTLLDNGMVEITIEIAGQDVPDEIAADLNEIGKARAKLGWNRKPIPAADFTLHPTDDFDLP